MNDIVSTEARGHRPKLMSTPEEKGWVGSPPLACNSSIETRITNVRVTAVSGDVSLNVLVCYIDNQSRHEMTMAITILLVV